MLYPPVRGIFQPHEAELSKCRDGYFRALRPRPTARKAWKQFQAAILSDGMGMSRKETNSRGVTSSRASGRKRRNINWIDRIWTGGMMKASGQMSQDRLPRQLLAKGSVTASIEEAGTAIVRRGVIYWRSLCGQKRFPARSDLTLRGMASFMPYVLIVRAVDGGADYEFAYVGDAQRQAFKGYFKGLRVSQIEAIAPKFAEVLRGVYDSMRSIGLPFIVRGRTDAGSSDSGLLYHESAFLPLGVGDAAVDHVLIVGVRIPEPFWDISMDEIQTLENSSNLTAAVA